MNFTIVENLLRHRERFLLEINHGTAIKEKIWAMLITSVFFLAVYGGLLGSTHSLWQILSSAIKLPLLFLVTLLICAPTLYIFSTLFDLRQHFYQSLSLVLVAITVTAIFLLSFSSVTLFFVMTAPGHYQFFKLLNVLFFIIAGGVGASFLNQGIRLVSSATSPEARFHRPVFYLWVAVYMFVGSQMAWTLRPFVGYPNAPFELFRQYGGSFYDNIFASVGEILGFFLVR